jgi:hypothetical protein
MFGLKLTHLDVEKLAKPSFVQQGCKSRLVRMFQNEIQHTPSNRIWSGNSAVRPVFEEEGKMILFAAAAMYRCQ